MDLTNFINQLFKWFQSFLGTVNQIINFMITPISILGLTVSPIGLFSGGALITLLLFLLIKEVAK